ncbi:hypothetical protein CRUP_004708 [Coryphaenoides rupestris]|nr:hypothetical protein CRUP_004708 [Coryphaenoides rupestris]
MERPSSCHNDSFSWDETECLNYYGLLSLHQVFQIVGAQLTTADVQVLSFLLDEAFCGQQQHPLDPAAWTVQPRGEEGDDPDDPGVPPTPALLSAWRRSKPRGQPSTTASLHTPKCGLDLLLELERRGYLSEGNLEPLLQLLRVLTRHDLLPLVSLKKRRTVSPERIGHSFAAENKEMGVGDTCSSCSSSPMPGDPTSRRKRRKRGHGWSRKPKRSDRPDHQQQQPYPHPLPPDKGYFAEVRLRVRAEYQEHEAALRSGVASDKAQPLERQFELFSRASSLLRARDLGSVGCHIKFTELDNLQAFWADYLSGALLEALKGVFLTDSLRVAAGREAVRLLINVDQDDYEEGCRVLGSSSRGWRSRRLSFSAGTAP